MSIERNVFIRTSAPTWGPVVNSIPETVAASTETFKPRPLPITTLNFPNEEKEQALPHPTVVYQPEGPVRNAKIIPLVMPTWNFGKEQSEATTQSQQVVGNGSNKVIPLPAPPKLTFSNPVAAKKRQC